MHPETFTEPEMATNGKLHSFSLYVDFPASIYAQWATSAIIKIARRHWQPSSEMWKLDSLMASEPIRKLISNDAANADVLIIAVSSLDRRELELIRWLDSLTALKTNRPGPGLLIALLGDEDSRALELDWTVKQLMRCAQQADRDFIWHGMGKNAMDDAACLTENVEKLLSRKQSTFDQIILQETASGIS
jgi:hypothetical protein